MKTKVNYLRKYNDTNTYSQTINVICSEKEVVKQYINSGHTYSCCAKPITIGTNYLTYNMIHKLSFNFWENNKRVKTDRNTILNIKIQ